MNKEIVVYPCNEILLSSKKKGARDTLNKMNLKSIMLHKEARLKRLYTA